MNPVVCLVVSALWAVADVLVDVEADYSSRVMIGSGVISADTNVAETPSSRHLRIWLARRLSSPPGFPRIGNT
jgi:hypothetical protein